MKQIYVITGIENFEFYQSFPLCDAKLEMLPLNLRPEPLWEKDVDIVLIDCGWDDGAGLARLSETKARRPDLPVLYLTDAGSETTAVSAFRLGARDYFRKPVDLLLLCNRIAAIILARRNSREWRRPLPVANCEQGSEGACRVGSETPPAILRVVRHIEKNIQAHFTVDQLAGKAGMSKFHFSREFKKSTGVSPMNFVNARRIERAKELLRKEDLQIFTVALKAGFSDYSNFIRTFKQFTGLTPTAYRDCGKEQPE
jgi:AraC-like DNA-binding protein/CheY-like chemotaxis protein